MRVKICITIFSGIILFKWCATKGNKSSGLYIERTARMATKNGGKILIVDDNISIGELYSEVLKREGYSVQFVTSGEDAIKTVENTKFDIVFMDLMLPRMSGVEACRGIKEISPDTEVVLLSGFPAEVQKLTNSFLQAGGRDEFLRKPILSGELEQVVRKIFKEKNKPL